MEYGGLKPILPFLEGRSDAARRVVIRLHASHPWGPHGFHNDAAREGWALAGGRGNLRENREDGLRP